MQPNPSITQMDMNGAEWLLNFKDSATNSVYIMSPVYRFLAGSLGHVEAGTCLALLIKRQILRIILIILSPIILGTLILRMNIS